MPDNGSGALNAGAAVDLGTQAPENLKLAGYLNQQNMAQQYRQDRMNQAAQAHKDALQKYYGNQFDIDKFDTKTALNEPIDDILSKGRQTVADAIQKGIDGGDLEKIQQQALAPAVQLFQKGTLIQQNLAQTSAALKTDPGIDSDAVYKGGMLAALYDQDPNTGKYIPKTGADLAAVDPEKDYGKEFISNHPELAAKGGVNWEGNIAKFAPN